MHENFFPVNSSRVLDHSIMIGREREKERESSIRAKSRNELNEDRWGQFVAIRGQSESSFVSYTYGH